MHALSFCFNSGVCVSSVPIYNYTSNTENFKTFPAFVCVLFLVMLGMHAQ